MTPLRKCLEFVKTTRTPHECVSRLNVIIESRLLGKKTATSLYNPLEIDRAAGVLEERYGWKIAGYFRDVSVGGLEAGIQERLRDPSAAMPKDFDGDPMFGRLCYALCRATRPKVVVETGVCRGVTSAYILRALADNDAGRLVSIDLPPLGAASSGDVGRAVPLELRQRWTLTFGSSRQMLPGVLRDCESVDLFIHDSLHTLRTMSWEFATVLPKLSTGGVLVADDVDCNRAFSDWMKRPEIEMAFTVSAACKSGMFGFSRLRSDIGCSD